MASSSGSTCQPRTRCASPGGGGAGGGLAEWVGGWVGRRVGRRVGGWVGGRSPGQQQQQSISLLNNTARPQCSSWLHASSPTLHALACSRRTSEHRQRRRPARPTRPAPLHWCCCCRYQDLQAGDIPVADKDGASGGVGGVGGWVGGWVGVTVCVWSSFVVRVPVRMRSMHGATGPLPFAALCRSPIPPPAALQCG